MVTRGGTAVRQTTWCDSDMPKPDDSALTPNAPPALRRDQMTEEELSVLALVERSHGRPLTKQEEFCALEQARMLGEIDDRPRCDG
jgi:hypothetical protein